MVFAQWDGHLYAGAFDTISTIVCLDGASVHEDNGATEVESDTCSLYVQVTGALTLIESFEQAVGLLILEADTRVDDLEDGLLFMTTYLDVNMSFIESILHGIGEDVADDFVEVDTVYPYIDGLVFGKTIACFQGDADISLLGIEVEERTDAFSEAHQVGLLTVQVHLVLIYLSFIENLVDEQEQALCIAIDSLQVLPALAVGDFLFQFVERSHDEGEWRADVVCGVDEELHLRFIEVGLTASLVGEEDVGYQCNDSQKVDDIGPCRSIPGIFHHNGDGGRLLGVHSVACSSHL